MAVRVSVDIEAPADVVWHEAADLASHVEWMRDADTIDFRSDQRAGEGTVMEVLTKVGPLKTLDVIEVTSWVEGREIGVVHRGVVTGRGRFVVDPIDDRRTRFIWEEELDLPWYFGGRFGRPVSERVLAAVWRANLRALKRRIEGAA